MISDLSQDLIEEILSRVPVTSLRQLRSTCKRWYHEGLFKDPRFIKKYFDKTARQYHALLLINYRVCSMSSVIDRIPTWTTLSLGGHYLIPPNGNVPVNLSQAFHCNGILLITPFMKKMIVVWNPFSGQTKWIQLQNHCMEAYALGYDNKELCRSYKILRIPCRNGNLQPWRGRAFDVTPEGDIKLKIYEFSSDSWRNLDAFIPDQAYLKLPYGGVSLNGNTYWVSCNQKRDNYSLLCFDFSTERFHRLCAPHFHHEPCHHDDTMVLSVVREEHLSFFYQSINTRKVEIWMTDEIETTYNDVAWTNFLTIDLKYHRFRNSMSFFIVDEEKKVVVCVYASEWSKYDMVWIVRGEEEKYRATPSISVRRGVTTWGLEPCVCLPRLLGYVPRN